MTDTDRPVDRADVEVTTRYATTVDDIPAAWSFVMSRVDGVGPEPRVEIKPIHQIGISEMIDGLNGAEDSQDWATRFEVVVEGTVRDD